MRRAPEGQRCERGEVDRDQGVPSRPPLPGREVYGGLGICFASVVTSSPSSSLRHFYHSEDAGLVQHAPVLQARGTGGERRTRAAPWLSPSPRFGIQCAAPAVSRSSSAGLSDREAGSPGGSPGVVIWSAMSNPTHRSWTRCCCTRCFAGPDVLQCLEGHLTWMATPPHGPRVAV